MARKRPGSPASVDADDPTTAYARQVDAGAIVAGPHVRASCARHLRDIADAGSRGLAWRPDVASEAFRFFETILCLNGGQFEGRSFVLEPSQKFIVGSIFGWLREDQTRRFRTAYIEQGKGNGKSPLVAGIGIKMLVADQEPRAEVYAFATKKDQAQILFRDAVAMVDQSPELDRLLKRSGGKGMEWNIADLGSASFFRSIASDDAQSGPRPHCAIGDEIHEMKSGMMLQMMRAGFKFRRQPLLVLITNSGTDKQSTCWEQHQYGTEVAAGLREDDEFFSYVCALDEADDPFTSEDCWIKANPLLDISVTREFLRGQVREALGMPSKESTVRRLHFCQWVEASDPLISPMVWTAAADEYDDELLRGRECYGGLDLSSTTDLTAFALLFAPNEYDPHWRQRTFFWLPADNLREKSHKDRVPYDAWRAAGWLETTPGKAVNKLHVLSRLVGFSERYDLRAIAYDRWRIDDLKSLMENEGVELPLLPFGQGFQSMAPAVDEYERLLIDGILKHDANPLMTWNATCAVAEADPAGNRKPTKERSNGRIDGLVAAIMAAGVAKSAEPAKTYQIFAIG
jgi:phage terminase large subunit-like protein